MTGVARATGITNIVMRARIRRSRTTRRSVEPSKMGSSDSWTCAGSGLALLVAVLRWTVGSRGGGYTPPGHVSTTRTVVPPRIGPPAPSATFADRQHPSPGDRAAMTEPRTIVDKIWDDHVVVQDPGAPAVLAIDLHLVHEVTSPQAFSGLRERGLTVRRPGQTVATADHSIPTTPRSLPMLDAQAAAQISQLEKNCADFGIPLHGIGSPAQGIVHVIGPQLGLTQPGMTIVCGDSHTSTHGAFGALAFGIGTSEVEMVLATQTLLQRDPKTYEVRVDGRLAPGVSSKDIILALIARIGVGGGTGHVFEYRGDAIRGLTMEQRMTVCNMSIEGGARAGLIAPDDTTFEYLHGREFTPKDGEWDNAVSRWRLLPSDDQATYDKTVTLDASALEPMITFGTNPGMGIKITERIPTLDTCRDDAQRAAYEK